MNLAILSPAIVLIINLYLYKTVHGFMENITACLLIERKTGRSNIYDYDRSAAGIDMAVDYANSFLLPENYILQTVYEDIGNQCSERSSIIGHAMRLQAKGITCNVYIGPGCGLAAEVLYDYATYFDIPVIGCPAAELGTSASIADYDLMTRVSITYTTLADVIVRFFRHQNYTTPVFVQDFSTGFFNVMNKVITETIKERHWELYYQSVFVHFDASSITNDKIRKTLTDAHLSSRVILLLAPAETVRRFMVQARLLGMTKGDHVFITVELFPSAIWGDYTWKFNDIYDAIAREAFLTLLVISLPGSVSSTIDHFWNQVVTKTALNTKYNFTRLGGNVGEVEVDPIVTHFYDAIILYGNVVRDLIAIGKDFRSAKIASAYTANYRFKSPVNEWVVLNNDSDRMWYYVIRSFDPFYGRFEECLGFPPISDDVDILGLFDDWPNNENQLPPNTPYCGFQNENAECYPLVKALSPQVTVGITIPLLIVVCGTSAILIALKKLREIQQSEGLTWRIYRSEVVDLDSKPVNSSAISCNSSLALTLPNLHPAINVAVFGGITVQVQELPVPHYRVSYNIHKDARLMQRFQHPNLQKLIGLVVSDENRCEFILTELCSKGCLDDLISDVTFDLDWEFKRSLIKDICNVKGLCFLHASPIKSHGHLSAFTCLVDSRFVLKLSHYGLLTFIPADILEPPGANLDESAYEKFLWRAPELLRGGMPPEGTQKGDIYSFSIILQQISMRSKPFRLASTSAVLKGPSRKGLVGAKEIVMEVKRGSFPPLRPPIPPAAFPDQGFLSVLMENCWNENPLLRPTLVKVKALILASAFFDRAGDNLVDHLIRKLEKHAIGLEREIDAKTTQFMEEKERSALLLNNILPKIIAQALMQGIHIRPEIFDKVTIYFGDIPNFGDLVAQAASTAAEYLQMLEGLYKLYDNSIENYDAHKIESLNDACLVVSGLPSRNGDRHVEIIADLALTLKKDVKTFRPGSSPQTVFRLRVGIHSGSCVAGIVGAKLPKYCIFGDTVNTASRMETTGEADRIQCSGVTKSLLECKPNYEFVARGTVTIKGKGPMETFWLVGTSNGFA